VNATTPTGRPRLFRRRYLIDKPTQLGLVAWLIGGLAGLAVMYVLAMIVFFGPEATADMDSPMLRRLLLTANTAFFLFAGIMITTLAIMLSHRFVGPAYVLRTALDAMLRGDFSKRLSLRKTDYMKDVAGLLTALRDRLVAREDQVSAQLESLERAVESGDRAEALSLAKSLREGSLVPNGTAAPAPSEASAPAASEKVGV
jgi:hypothetical protein